MITNGLAYYSVLLITVWNSDLIIFFCAADNFLQWDGSLLAQTYYPWTVGFKSDEQSSIFHGEQLRTMISRIISWERESWERFYANCPNFSNYLCFILCYSFLLCHVVALLVLLFLWIVVLVALDWGTVPVSTCGVAFGILWPTLADFNVE